MDVDLYEVFGVERPAEDVGENAQEVAEPAEENGENEQEVAEPAEVDEDGEEIAAESTENNENGAETVSEGSDVGEDAKPAQTKEERAKHAAARRRAEREAAVAAERERATAAGRAAAIAECDELIKGLGIKNPYNNGAVIETVEQLRSYKEQYETRGIDQRMQSGKATREDIRRIVEEIPAVKEAAEAVAKAKEAEENARQAAFEAEVKSQIEQIHALDPTVNELEDILKMDNADEFRRAVKEHRMTYLEAFRFVNMDRLAKRQQENAARETAMRGRGKEHMKPVSSRGAGAVAVPADQMALYKAMMPDATDEEISRHYNKYVSR